MIFGPSSNVKIAFRMSKCDIWPELHDKIGIRMSNAIFVLNSNVKTGSRMPKCNIRPEFDCRNRILNVKMRYSAVVRMFKYDFECQNVIFCPSSNVKIAFQMSLCDIRSELNDKQGIGMSKCDIRPIECRRKQDLERQNAIFGPNSNVKIGIRMSK